ncbi:MAG TPA: tRNA (adenosine(37)-N6)-threonylcarbamoyltransferase complex dimerization subunit type 1 TsaB [Candidatus Babeliales bacterium]|nr:tRNA (adenosine(37)-N6)-threonylcarbamoyltransferase complex dimerization subunit type 1 TsaB [Candidatus Babeliales bacterium]
MTVLALDGALYGFSAAISREGSIVASRCEPGNVALERGLALVDGLLAEARLQGASVDRLAVGTGPGGFTGLRIAVAYAKSLAAVWQRPLVPISSFDILEYGAGFDCALAVVVGRPGVISARYRCVSQTWRASGRVADVLDALLPAILRPDEDDGSVHVVGAPEDVLHALAERGIIVRPFDPRVMPAAAAAALLAPSRTPPASPHAVRADYGELPAVKPPRS